VHYFDLKDGVLHAEGVSLETLAAEVGTPTYVYSSATLRRHYGLLRDACDAHREALGHALIAFAVKANSNLSVLATLAQLGCGADTVSEGEIRRALAAGVPGERGHAKITTGGAGDKFGVPVEEALSLYARASASPHVTPVGLACHIGSQITDLTPLESAFRVLRQMTETLRAQGHSVTRLDLGGGLGVPYYGDAETASPADYVAMAARVLDGLDVEAAFEPGRLMAANAGVLLSRVIQVNERTDGRRFLVLDAAMNDLMRPALYDAFHDLKAVRPRDGADRPYDVVGPVCETGDTFARDRDLPPFEAGDLVVFMSAGAYGAVMSGEYNTRPLAAEVLVDGQRCAVIRPRPTYEQMFAREPMADWL